MDPMTAVLSLFLVSAVWGAWDTLWYHEYRARLVSRLDHTRTELRLHVVRDAVYVGLYAVLGFGEPTGVFAAFLATGLVVEIVATLADFVVEDRDRPAIGGIAPGERILHTLMAISYGAMLALLLPQLLSWLTEPTALTPHDAPLWLRAAVMLTSVGILGTALRDAAALRGFDPFQRWLPVEQGTS